jgi:DNA-directed RNA polymerase subunit beta'
MCYGWNLANGRMSELGETVGIIAAQSIGEPGTQLTMRTFHTGGIFSGQTEKILVSPITGIIKYDINNEVKKIKTKFNEDAVFTKQEIKLEIKDKKGKYYRSTIPKNSLIFVKPNKEVYYKQILAQVIKFEKGKKKMKEKKEIKTTLSGLTTIKEKILWVVNNNIVSFEQLYSNIKKEVNNQINSSTRKATLKITLKLSLNNFIKMKKKFFIKTNKCTYILEKKLKTRKEIIINKKQSDQYIKIKTKKFHIINKISRNTSIELSYKNSYSSQIIQKRKTHILLRKAKSHTLVKNRKNTVSSTIPIKKNSSLFEIIYKKQKTEDIVQGLPKVEQLLEIKKVTKSQIIPNNPDEKLRLYLLKLKEKYTTFIAIRKSVQRIQKYLITKIQDVYLSQGVTISDKHVEIIIKQMTAKVIITEANESPFLAGEIIDLNRIEKTNTSLKNKATYEPIILGISKIAQTNSSFISQASFQETIKSLSTSALKGNTDWLQGLKENIILGNLIPAGTTQIEINIISK